jgi:hypothetical protein
MIEVHPITEIFAEDSLDVAVGYFHDPAGHLYQGDGTYAERTAAFTHTRSVEWRHPLGSVVSALCSAGLTIDHLREHDYTVYGRWPFLERRTDGTDHLPHGMPRLPLLYSLRATKR